MTSSRSARSALLSLVLVAALAAPEARAQQSRLSTGDVARWAALLRMTDARAQDTAVVVAALAARSPALRAAGALAIGQARVTAMTPTLRRLLADRDTAVAASAAYALGLLRDSASVAALASALRAGAPVALEAAWALGQIGAPSRASIEQALAAAGRDDRVIGALLLAASRLRPVPVEWATRFFQHPNPEVRWRAAYVVARPFAAAGVRAIMPLAADTTALVRAQVARALSRAAAGDSLRGLALPLLDSLSRDRHPHVRVNAVRSLGTYGTTARAPLLAALRDRDANVRVTAAQSIGDALDPHRELWAPLWESDTGFMFRRSLLASALQAGVALPALELDGTGSWSRSSDWRFRAAVAEAASASPSPE